MKTCWKCGGETKVAPVGPLGQQVWFGLCFGACAGKATVGSPLTDGKPSQHEAEVEMGKEARKAIAAKAAEVRRHGGQSAVDELFSGIFGGGKA